MEIGFHPTPSHPDGFFYARLIVNGKFLRKNMNNFFSWRQHELIHVGNKAFNIDTANFVIIAFGKNSTVLNTLDVLTSNPNINHLNIYIRLPFSHSNSLANTSNRFLNIRNYPTIYTRGLCLTHT